MMKKILFCMTALLLLVACKAESNTENSEANETVEATTDVAAEDGNWAQQTTIQSAKPMVVDFFATWCGPCKQLAPILEEVEKNHEGEVIFQRIDVDENQDLAQEFKIEAVPTLMFITPKGEYQTLIGLQDAAAIEAKIAELVKRSAQ